MKHITNLIVTCLALALLSGCAITHKYGPYMGKVVDKETNEPIEGAVVIMRFYTESIVGDPSHFVDALEVLTDDKGEFHIDSTWIFTFMPMTYWDSYPHVVVFKPGYGAYPWHRGTDLDKWEDNNFPRKDYVTVSLPKLDTLEERAWNQPSLGEAEEHLYVFSQLYDQERITLGFKPYSLRNYYRHKGLISPHEKTIDDYPLYRRSYEVLKSGGFAGVGKGINNDGAVIFHSYPIKNPYPCSIKYNFQEEQAELKKALEIKGLKFIVTENSTVKFSIENKDEIDKIIKKIDNKPRMLFFDKEKKDNFISLLQEEKVPFILRTVPKHTGYDIIWDHENNEKVEKLKINLFNNVLK